MSKNFYELVKHSTQESHVQEAYNNAFKSFFNVPIIERKHQCDGYFETKTSDNKEISVLIEYKYDIHMKDKVQRSKVIAQCLGYLKQFEQSGEKLPKLIFIGDINECCVIHTNDLLKLLDLENVDWSVAPSSMGDKNIDLVVNIAKDISPWVYDVNEDFNFQDVADKIVDLCSNTIRKLHITEKNIEKVYNLFCDRVIKDRRKIQANDLVSTFIGVMLDPNNYYKHPRKKNALVANDKLVTIDGDQYDLFMQMHSIEYSPKEKRIMTAISDRLIEDTNRRNKGEFYTPTLFVDYAHGMIEKELGQHWKENYVVWDCCCGTKNLTRDYRFKELYCSTLEQAELDISKNYNKEATSFQFDFLNDSLDDLKIKAPGLLEAFELNRPICFFINPPYAKGSGVSGVTTSGNSKVQYEMNSNKMGVASSITYCMFLYRLCEIKQKYSLTNVYIALFCNPSFIQNSGCKTFRKYFLDNYKYKNGCYFNAGHFASVTASWGITFNIWSCGKCSSNEFDHIVIDNIGGEIVELSHKTLYNVDTAVQANKWAKIKENVDNLVEVSLYKNVLQPHTDCKVKFDKSSLGFFLNHSNNVQQNSSYVNIFSMPAVQKVGTAIYKENFYKICSLFSARSLTESSWINHKDEYLVPNESHSAFKEFVNNSIVYTIIGSSVSSVTDDSGYKHKNEFFWMSKQEMLDLAEEYNNDYTYEDALNSEERFVYTKLQEIKDDLSPEAKAVLDKATELVKTSFKYREMFNESHPEYQINNWDCGFYQIKALLKEFMPDNLKDFRSLYKQLADKMRPMIYELGFLKS